MSTGAKLFWRMIGWFLFLFGLAGLVIPLFPTTIFWILAALALQRSDPAFAERIRGWPQVGPAVANFLDHGVISAKGKLAAGITMGASAALTTALVDDRVVVGAALGALGAVALYVATRPSRLRDEMLARRIPPPIGGAAPTALPHQRRPAE